jgi:hypothetical protein
MVEIMEDLKFVDVMGPRVEFSQDDMILTLGRAISNAGEAKFAVSGKDRAFLEGQIENYKGALGWLTNQTAKAARLLVLGSMVSQMATACAPRTASAQDMIASTTAITESYTPPKPAAEFTPTLTVSKEPTATATIEPTRTPTPIAVEISVDGNYVPVPDAFVDTGLGKIKEIKDLEEPNDTINKVVEKIKEKLSIQNDEDLQKAYLDIVCENGNRAYMIVKDNKTATSYAVFVKDKNGFYLPPDSDGELVLLPVKTVSKDGKELIGFDVKGDLLIPPTFTFSTDTGELTYTEPKTGEEITITKESNTAPKMRAMLTAKNNGGKEQVFIPGKLPTPEQPLTPKQQSRFEYIRKNLEVGGYFSDASLFEISFNADDKAVITDRVSGRVLSVDLKWNYLDPVNVSGKDQLEDGSWVFNSHLVKRLGDEGLEKTHLKGINGVRNNPSSEVDDYNWEIFKEMGADNPGVLEEMVGGLSSNESLVWRSIPLYVHPDGTYSWGIVVGKHIKNGGWDEGKRVLVYKDSSGTIKYIPLYFPNYLIYR